MSRSLQPNSSNPDDADVEVAVTQTVTKPFLCVHQVSAPNGEASHPVERSGCPAVSGELRGKKDKKDDIKPAVARAGLPLYRTTLTSRSAGDKTWTGPPKVPEASRTRGSPWYCGSLCFIISNCPVAAAAASSSSAAPHQPLPSPT